MAKKRPAAASSQRTAIEHSIKRAGRYIKSIMRTDDAGEQDACRDALTEIMHYCSKKGFCFRELLDSAEDAFMEEIELAFGEDDDPDAPLFLTHKGVSIYHVLKHGQEGPVSEYWYCNSSIAAEVCKFDIRELPTWDGKDHAASIKQAINRGILRNEVPWKSVGAKRKKAR